MSVGSYIALLVTLGGAVPLSAAAANWSDPNGERGLAHRLLVASLTWSNVQVATVLLLLALGILHVGSLLVMELALATLGGWLYRRSPRHRYRPCRTSDSLAWIGGAAAPVVALMAWRVLTQPVVEFDSLYYHMPQLVEWLQAGSLVQMRHVWSDFHTYAYGWEALAAVFVLPLGQDVLVSAPNLLAWLLYAAATYALARRVGARPAAAALGSLVLLCFPIVRFGVGSLQVDLAFGAFFMLGVYFALCYADHRAPADLCAFIAASASMFWVKLSALPYGFLLFVALGSMLLVFRGRSSGERSGIDARGTVLAAAFGLLAFMPVLYFYGRNWLELGNPLGYVHLPPFFEGDPARMAFLRKTTLLELLDVRSAAHRAVLKDAAIAGLGVPGLVTGAFGIVAVLRVLKRPRLVLPVVLLPVTLLLYMATPYSADNRLPFDVTPFMQRALRYGFAWIGMTAVLGAVGMSILPRFATAALAIGVSGLVVMTSAGGYPEALGAISAGVPTFLIWQHWKNSPSEMRRIWPFVIAAGLIGMFLTFRIVAPLRLAHRAAAYGPVAAHLDSHAAKDEIIAILYADERGDAQPVYPLYGPDLSRRLHILPSSETGSLDFLEELRLRWFVVDLPRLKDLRKTPRLRATAFDPKTGWMLFERDERLQR